MWSTISRRWLGFCRVAWLIGAVVALVSGCRQAAEQAPVEDPAGNAFSEGYRLHREHQWEAAIAQLDEAIRLNPKNTKAYFLRAEARDNNAQPYLAIADYSQVIYHDPDSAAAYLSRGKLYRSRGFADKALHDLTQAIRLEPRLL
jgi:tetratricopeptide (TPR) repeat protein